MCCPYHIQLLRPFVASHVTVLRSGRCWILDLRRNHKTIAHENSRCLSPFSGTVTLPNSTTAVSFFSAQESSLEEPAIPSWIAIGFAGASQPRATTLEDQTIRQVS